MERVEWLSRQFDLVEITLQQPSHGVAVAYHATPLHPVDEGSNDDEVRKGDLAVLVSDPAHHLRIKARSGQMLTLFIGWKIDDHRRTDREQLFEQPLHDKIPATRVC